MKLGRDVVIEIDTRENKPFAFPTTIQVKTGPRSKRNFRLHTVSKRLDAGDYRLSSHPSIGGIERKSGLNELSQNLMTRDKSRFKTAFTKFIDQYRNPMLVIEGNPCELLKAPRYIPGAYPGEIADYVSALSIRTGVPIIFLQANTNSKKLQAGEFVARWLIQSALIAEE